MTRSRVFIFFVVLFLSNGSFAASTVVWYSASSFIGAGNTTGDTRYSSPNSACAAVVPAGYSEGYGYANQCYAKLGGTSYTIGSYQYHTETCSNGSTGLYCNLEGGQSCQGEGTADSGLGFITNADGQCVDWTDADGPSQCKSLAGRTGKSNVLVSYDSDGNPLTPPPLSLQGCEAIAYGVGQCKMKPSRGSSGGLGISIEKSMNKCLLDVKFTGNTAPGGPLSISHGGSDGLCDPASPCPPPEDPPNQNDSKPCVYVYDGEGRKVCSSNQWNAQPGQSSCGTVNGNFVCIGKAPASNGISIDTTVTDKQNPDGSTTTTKEDKITQTICKGAYSCSTQNTTNKTSIIKDAAGNTTGKTNECTGPHCAVAGAGDSDGDGLKDCVGTGCTGSGSGNGDGEGEGEEFTGPENDEVPGFGESLSNFMSSVEGSPIVSAMSGVFSIPSGGSCSFQSFQVPILGTLSFQPMCAWAADWLAPLRYLMLAVWAIVAVRTFLEA